jgi:hypothetical protein
MPVRIKITGGKRRPLVLGSVVLTRLTSVSCAVHIFFMFVSDVCVRMCVCACVCVVYICVGVISYYFIC